MSGVLLLLAVFIFYIYCVVKFVIEIIESIQFGLFGDAVECFVLLIVISLFFFGIFVFPFI